MDPVILGATGVRVPRVAVGTATFGLQCTEEQSRSILDAAFDQGLTWFDTSPSYPLGSGPDVVGVSEEILGRWLTSRREQCFISTKVYNRSGSEPWRLGLSRKHIVGCLEDSLRRLGTDYVDLLQLHRFDSNTPIDETLSALESVVESGKVLYVGCCNFLGYQIVEATYEALTAHQSRLRTAQVRYNLLMRGPEVEVLPACLRSGVAPIAFNLLAGGILTGKYQNDKAPPATSRFAIGEAGKRYMTRYWLAENFEMVAELSAIANEWGFPLATLAICWVLANPSISAGVVGVSRPDHLDTVMQALNMELDPDLFDRLTLVSQASRRFVEELEFESS